MKRVRRSSRMKEDFDCIEEYEDMPLDEVKYQLAETNNDISQISSDVFLTKRKTEKLELQVKEEKEKKAKRLKAVNELEQQIKMLKSNKPYRAQDFPSLHSYLEDMEQENIEDANEANTPDLVDNPETNDNYETELKLFIEEALLYKTKFGIETTSLLLDGYLDTLDPHNNTLNQENPGTSKTDNLFINSDLHCNKGKQSEIVNLELTNNNLKPTWTIIKETGMLLTPRLFDGLGHYLHQVRVGKTFTSWCCTKIHCKARVRQIGDDFVQFTEHKCKPIPGIEEKFKCEAVIAKYVSDKKFVNSIKTGSVIIQEFAKRGYTNLPSVRGITGAIRQYRKNILPPNPEDLWFDIDMDFIPDKFLQGEVVVRYRKETKRHLIFATEQQMSMLGIAERWYLDLTYKLVSNPFIQILIINVWIPYRMVFKHIPLAFVLMSRTTTKDFKCVFEKLLEIFKNEVNVEELVCDYQTSLWKAVKSSFPCATVTGCGFHWFQDVLRAVKKCGLAILFMNNQEVKKVCQRLLCLYLLPAEKIPKIFSILKKKAAKLDLGVESARQLSELFSHVETTWINNPIWPIHIWSMFGEPIRNYYVLWNRSRTYSRKWSFYCVIDILFTICEKKIAWALNDNQQLCVPLYRENLIENFRQAGPRTYVSHIYSYFDDYQKGFFNALKLLKLCAEKPCKEITLLVYMESNSQIDYDQQKVIETTPECPCS